MTNNRRKATFSFVDVLLMTRDDSSERHKSDRFFSWPHRSSRIQSKLFARALAHRSVIFNAARKSQESKRRRQSDLDDV